VNTARLYFKRFLTIWKAFCSLEQIFRLFLCLFCQEAKDDRIELFWFFPAGGMAGAGQTMQFGMGDSLF
jgi:hypothetical protein